MKQIVIAMTIYERPNSNEKISLDGTDEYGGLSGKTASTGSGWNWTCWPISSLMAVVPAATEIAFLVTEPESSIIKELLERKYHAA